jgi:hypothetical protein
MPRSKKKYRVKRAVAQNIPLVNPAQQVSEPAVAALPDVPAVGVPMPILPTVLGVVLAEGVSLNGYPCLARLSASFLLYERKDIVGIGIVHHCVSCYDTVDAFTSAIGHDFQLCSVMPLLVTKVNVESFEDIPVLTRVRSFRPHAHSYLKTMMCKRAAILGNRRSFFIDVGGSKDFELMCSAFCVPYFSIQPLFSSASVMHGVCQKACSHFFEDSCSCWRFDFLASGCTSLVFTFFHVAYYVHPCRVARVIADVLERMPTLSSDAVLVVGCMNNYLTYESGEDSDHVPHMIFEIPKLSRRGTCPELLPIFPYHQDSPCMLAHGDSCPDELLFRLMYPRQLYEYAVVQSCGEALDGFTHSLRLFRLWMTSGVHVPLGPVPTLSRFRYRFLKHSAFLRSCLGLSLSATLAIKPSVDGDLVTFVAKFAYGVADLAPCVLDVHPVADSCVIPVDSHTSLTLENKTVASVLAGLQMHIVNGSIADAPMVDYQIQRVLCSSTDRNLAVSARAVSSIRSFFASRVKLSPHVSIPVVVPFIQPTDPSLVIRRHVDVIREPRADVTFALDGLFPALNVPPSLNVHDTNALLAAISRRGAPVKTVEPGLWMSAARFFWDVLTYNQPVVDNRLDVVPYDEWIEQIKKPESFKKILRATLFDVRSGHFPKRWQEYSLFLKRQKNPTDFFDVSVDRIIEQMSHLQYLLAGRGRDALATRLQQMFICRNMVYPSHLDSSQLGSVFSHLVASLSLMFAIEIDCSAFDGHVHIEAQRAELWVYSHFTFEDFSLFSKMIASQQHTVASGVKLGASFSVDGTRQSGVHNTSLGNTLLSLIAYTYAIRESVPGLRSVSAMVEFCSHSAMFQNGDDCLILLPGGVFVDRERFLNVVASLGFVPKPIFHDELSRVTFSSGHFVPFQNTHVFCVKCGRLLAKFGYFLDCPKTLAGRRGIMMGMLHSLHDVVVHHPLLGRICAVVWDRLTAGVFDARQVEAEIARHAYSIARVTRVCESISFTYCADVAAEGWFASVYGVSAANLYQLWLVYPDLVVAHCLAVESA